MATSLAPSPAPARLRWKRLAARALATDTRWRAQWDALNARRLNLPFLDAHAVAAALAAFGDGREQLVVGEGPDGPHFMAVMAPTGRLTWSTFQASQIPLGACVSAGPGIADTARQLVRSSTLGLCLAVSFTQLDSLQDLRADDADDNRHDDYIDTAWMEIEGDFETYWAARGKNLRQNLRKQRNKLTADGVATSLRWLREPDDVVGALQRYGALESAGWKAGRGTAIHPDNAQGRFYQALLGEAARRGEMLLSEYRFGDQLVAMNLGLLRQGTWIVLKTAYDESVPKALSPASLLREDELQAIFSGQAGVRRIEYYGRVMEWHTKLTEQQRGLYHLTTFRWPWLKRLHQRRRAAASSPPVAQGSES